MSGKREARRLYWQDLLDRQSKSGLSIRQFCSEHRLSEQSFYLWRRRLGSEVAERHEQGTQPVREFIPLTLLDDSRALEVIHPCGYRIRISGEVNAAALKCILDILDTRRAQ